MTHGQPAPGASAEPAGGMHGRDRHRAQRRARLVLAALLLVLAAAGIRAADPAVGSHGPLHQEGKLVGLAVEIVLAALLIALSRRRARSEIPLARPPHVAYQLNAILRTVVGICLVALPAVAFLDNFRPRQIQLPRQPATKNPPPRRLHKPPPPPSGHTITEVAGWLLITGLLVAIIVSALLIWHWRRPARRGAAFDAVPDEDLSAELRRAVESGRRALARIDDARAAIIACYVAMEQSLAGAGAVRAAAETPGELLTRAAAGGVVRGEAAGRLTALFYEARFSGHPVPQAHRTAALQALTDLESELKSGLESGLESGPAPGPGAGPKSAAADVPGDGRGAGS